MRYLPISCQAYMRSLGRLRKADVLAENDRSLLKGAGTGGDVELDGSGRLVNMWDLQVGTVHRCVGGRRHCC